MFRPKKIWQSLGTAYQNDNIQNELADRKKSKNCKLWILGKKSTTENFDWSLAMLYLSIVHNIIEK